MTKENIEKKSTCSESSGNGEEQSKACPCNKSCSCAEKAPAVGLAILLGGLGFLAFRTARKRFRNGRCCA